MIEVYTGVLGGGKTYKAVRRSAKYLASGGVLATNIEILFEPMRSYVVDIYGYEIEPQQIITLENSYEAIRRFHKDTPRGSLDHPTLAIIDEAGIFLNTRDSSHTRELADWLRLSRKDATDVIFIAQDFKDIDVAIRRLCLYVWAQKDLATVGIPGVSEKVRVRSKFIEQAYYASSGKPVEGTKRIVSKEARIFTLYRTEQMFRDFNRLTAGKLGRKVAKKRITVSLVRGLGMSLGSGVALYLYILWLSS